MVCLNEIVMIVVYGTIRFAKAFDKVPHRRLLRKLEYYGIRGSIHKWINSWHSTSCFRWPSLRSSPSAIRCAPRIGPRSGLVPHVHKINDLPDNIRSSQMTVSCIGIYIHLRIV